MQSSNTMITAILDRARAGIPPERRDCRQLLSLAEDAPETDQLLSAARQISGQRFGVQGVIKAQIGIATHRCSGACSFCGFGDGVTAFQPTVMPVEEVMDRAVALAASGELHALLLMTMHDYQFSRLLKTVSAVRAVLPPCTQLAVNIGDVDTHQARELAGAGVGGAYHVCRLGEGVDTALDPVARRQSIRAFREAGIDWYTCCEPIGPEHTPAELVEQIFLGIEYGCYQHAAMRRIPLPGTPMAARGQISEARLAQITAVVTLASLALPGLTAVSVHEPNLPSLLAGANGLSAEAGANPRDTAQNTEAGRGWSIERCKALLRQAGYRELLRADGTTMPLQLHPSFSTKE